MHSLDIPLRHLGSVVAECWDEAEAQTSKSIEQKYFDPQEEHVTFLFASELRGTLNTATQNGRIDRAFRGDLDRALPAYAHQILDCSGLVARATFHGRHHEGRVSGSDLGLVVRHPKATLDPFDHTIELQPQDATGMLAQAKIGSDVGPAAKRWGRLSRNQPRLISPHLEYFSLLLYRVGGESANKLLPFSWQPCSGHQVENIESWLKAGAFPSELTSTEVINRIFQGKIGTNDPAIIQRVIDPVNGGRSIINIEIDWPDDARPPATLRQRIVAPMLLRQIQR
jgi:hypothetical protein